MISDHERGTGRTTRQLKVLQDKSLFIWVNGYLTGCYNLCEAIGGQVNKAQHTWFRDDGAVIKIYGSDMLLTRNCHKLYGWDFSEIVLDHALRPCRDMREGLSRLQHSSNLDL